MIQEEEIIYGVTSRDFSRENPKNKNLRIKRKSEEKVTQNYLEVNETSMGNPWNKDKDNSAIKQAMRKSSKKQQ